MKRSEYAGRQTLADIPAPGGMGTPPCELRTADRRRGFTLVELLVVLAIIATLLAIAVPRYFQHVDRSKEAVLRENLSAVRDAIDQYHADKGKWPDSLESLADSRYLRAVPADPVTGSADTWITVPPPEGEAGVYDIRSGAEGTASDGKTYAEW